MPLRARSEVKSGRFLLPAVTRRRRSLSALRYAAEYIQFIARPAKTVKIRKYPLRLFVNIPRHN